MFPFIFIINSSNISLTVKENIMVPMILEKKPSTYMEKKVFDLMNLFGIKHIANKYPYQISGGEQQRVAVSRALVNEPDIILADEPTGNLDSKSSSTVLECFDKIVTELQTAVLVVTHDVFAASYCDKVTFIQDGSIHSHIVKKGTRKEFIDQIMDSLAILGGRTYDI